MMLSDVDIQRAVHDGEIVIDPFREEQLNPNSYNLRWTDRMKVYQDFYLDSVRHNPTLDLPIPNSGTKLEPNQLYLFTTEEAVGSNWYVPMLEGRSSLGRLGISIHITAGFGDIGFFGQWTLEVTVVQPVWIYPFMEVCQVFFHRVQTPPRRTYNGKYQDQRGITPHIPD